MPSLTPSRNLPIILNSTKFDYNLLDCILHLLLFDFFLQILDSFLQIFDFYWFVANSSSTSFQYIDITNLLIKIVDNIISIVISNNRFDQFVFELLINRIIDCLIENSQFLLEVIFISFFMEILFALGMRFILISTIFFLFMFYW